MNARPKGGTMRHIMLAVACVLFALPVVAQQPNPVRVYVFTAHPEGGIVDQVSKDRDKHVKDISDWLKEDKTITVVADRIGADVTLEVMKIEDVPRSAVIIEGRWYDSSNNRRVEVQLSFGDYTTEFHEQYGAITRRIADNDIVNFVKRWVKDNRQRVLDARVK
jgi:hypothetical protein